MKGNKFNQMNKTALISGSFFGLLTVIIGAFGAHALQEILIQNDRLDTFETAVQYQSMHALALILIGILSEKINSKLIDYAASAMILGILVFSGSLYTLSISSISAFGAITPIGGLFFLAGWVMLLAATIKN